MVEYIPVSIQYDYEFINDHFIKELIKGTLEYYKKIDFIMPWISYLVKDGKNYIGICSFKGKPVNNIVEIAYCTNPNYENCGYATKMCKKLIEIAENENNQIGIIARTLPETNASTSVLKKNGFKNNGIVIDPEDGKVYEWIL